MSPVESKVSAHIVNNGRLYGWWLLLKLRWSYNHDYYHTVKLPWYLRFYRPKLLKVRGKDNYTYKSKKYSTIICLLTPEQIYSLMPVISHLRKKKIYWLADFFRKRIVRNRKVRIQITNRETTVTGKVNYGLGFPQGDYPGINERQLYYRDET